MYWDMSVLFMPMSETGRASQTNDSSTCTASATISSTRARDSLVRSSLE